jgi:NitT/TauT family transport system permease protein
VHDPGRLRPPIRRTNPSRSFGASSLVVLRTVVLPGSLPHALTGVRQAVAHGLAGVVVGEVFSAGTGVGYVLNQAAQSFQTDRLFAVVVLLAVTAFGLNEVLPAARGGPSSSWRRPQAGSSAADTAGGRP